MWEAGTTPLKFGNALAVLIYFIIGNPLEKTSSVSPKTRNQLPTDFFLFSCSASSQICLFVL